MNTLPGNSVFRTFARLEPFARFRESILSREFPLELHGVHGAYHAFLVSQAATAVPGTLLVVVPTQLEAESIASDLEYFGAAAEIFPWWGAMPYRAAALHSQVFGDRAACLARLAEGRTKIILAVQRAFQAPLPPPEYLKSLLIALNKGDSIDPFSLESRFSAYGYLKVPRVSLKGEFALRGEVLDIWLPGDEEASRVVFEYDTIEEIRKFSPGDQFSTTTTDSVTVYPLKEIVWDEERIAPLRRSLADAGLYPKGGIAILEALSTKHEAKGEELFYSLAFEKPASLLDYLGPDGLVFFLDYDRLSNQAEALERECLGMYRRARMEAEVPPPRAILLDFRECLEKAERKVLFRTLKSQDSKSPSISFGLDPARSFFGNIQYFKEELVNLGKAGYSILIFAESEVQAQRLGLILKEFPVTVLPRGISQGFGIPQQKVIVIQENEIFGRKKHIPKSVRHAQSRIIDTFVELNPGDFVVHVNYGIGRFFGIERMKVAGLERDYIKLEYAEEENVFIPIEQVNLIQRYIGNEGNEPKLDRIGSKVWENRKNRVRKSVEDLAERLIRLYSRRKAARGFPFPRDGEWQTLFEATFPFEETEDQLKCIEEVKVDMESDRPMDRMVCGDVGYGKTEIAMRACFKAVMGGKQVAMLAPTTILAEQHFENFQDRLRRFPVQIAMLSRLVPKSDQKKTVERLQRGEIDVIIGTHRIIQKDVLFKDLGLLIVDEEQRFGVKDKERLKEIKANVDCLTLTATPIPRTLHMSLLKIRDMSVLSTPPDNRHPVETVIEEFDSETISRAIRKEVERGGQIFYLHNRVESLDDTRLFIQNLVPEVIVESAHGQMDGQDLDDVMHRFIHGGFHVLVSTTIIENGIDIPNVNTIVIDRADMFGISQLYQLRGRVGRSDRVAYAYLFYPEKRALSELAMKRLQIISDFTDLGSGFKIAMKDMEVRGAGNLLGREQSGEIFSVGFDLYLKLLNEAVQKLSDENWRPEEEAYLELEYAGFIPDAYIKLPTLKIEAYKKIASISTQEELDRVYAELEDRFGPIPDEVLSLLSLAEIRILCKRLSIASIKERAGYARVEFTKVSKVSVEKVIRLLKESGEKIRLDPHAPNVLIVKTGSIGLKEKSEYIREKLHSLTA